MAKRASSKRSKSSAIHDIEKQVDHFVDLQEKIKELVPYPSQPPWKQQWGTRFGPPAGPARPETAFTMGQYCEDAVSRLREAKNVLDRLRLEDDALEFEDRFNDVYRYYGSFTNSRFDVSRAYNASQVIISASIDQLDAFKQTIEDTWDNDMGSNVNVSNSTNTNVTQGGGNITVVASQNAASQPQLAQALSTLTQAVQASHILPADQKEEQVKVINQIGKEAAEPKPNKTLLKYLADGLLATLKAVPDVASAVTAVMPILSQLHL